MGLEGVPIDLDSADWPTQLKHNIELLWKDMQSRAGIGVSRVPFYADVDLRFRKVVGSQTSSPAYHKSTHQDGGADEMSVAGLSGLLADPQTPLLATALVRGGIKIGDVFTVDGSEFLVLAVDAAGGIEKVASAIAVKVRANYGIVVDANGVALKKQAAEADETTADASDLATAIALANALKGKMNSILAKLRSAEVIAT